MNYNINFFMLKQDTVYTHPIYSFLVYQYNTCLELRNKFF